MNIDPVDQRAGEPLLVARDDRCRADTLALGIAGVAAWAGVHRRDQREVGRKGERATGAADRHDPIFQRLPQHIQGLLAELRQFIQKQHAAMRAGDLARPDLRAAADQAGLRDRVVRRAERAQPDQRRVARQHAADRVDLGDFERLGQAHRRQDRRHRARHQRLARARAARHQHVMSTGGGDLQRALDVFLALDILEIDRVDHLRIGRIGPAR